MEGMRMDEYINREAVLCGQCVFSDISMSIPCAYICRKEKSPCYNRVTCADFGCLYGERKSENEADL